MNYYVREVQTGKMIQRTAGIKARDDIETILSYAGYTPIVVEDRQEQRAQMGRAKKMIMHFTAKKEWDNKFEELEEGDHLLLQFPVFSHTIFMGSVLHKLQRRGVHVTLLIHDLETLHTGLRSDTDTAKKIRLHLEEVSIMKAADHVIAHNITMKRYLVRLGVRPERIVSLKIFDYLIPGFDPEITHPQYKAPVIIAGALRRHKAGYAYHLPKDYPFNLYGVDYTGRPQENVHYFGSFPSDELTGVMRGSFGLVWDGSTTKTCAGTFGQYLKINDPHKTSLYLACGIPVIIWDQAALAPFIEKHRCGITVSSIDEINGRLSAITPEMYKELETGAAKVGKRLRAGYYTRRAISKCEDDA